VMGDLTWLVTAASVAGVILNNLKHRGCFVIWIVTNSIWMVYDWKIGARASRRADAEEERAGIERPAQLASQVKCLRCGGEWYPRVARPSVCPYCHSAKWDTERTGREPGPKPRLRS